MSEWISVKDKLPELEAPEQESRPVLTYSSYRSLDNMVVGIYGVYTESKGFWSDGERHLLVTHWMPLPEPPVEAKPIDQQRSSPG